MKATACLLAAIALLCDSIAARKSYLVKEEHKGMIPNVGATSYPYEKFYENFDDSLFVYYQAKLAAAWEWNQVMEENQDAYPDVYHLTLDIIFKQSAYFSPVFNFPRLIYLEPVLNVEEFTVGYKVDIAKFWIYPDRTDLLCFSSMFKISDRTILNTLIMRFQECYKTLWNCIYNLDNWSSEDAKYFENCSQSSKTTITTFEKEWEEETFGVMGSDDDDILRTGSNCTPGTGFWPFFIGDLQTSFTNNLLHYVAGKSGYGNK